LLLHADRVVLSYIFPATDIGVTALSNTAAIILGTIFLRIETKLAPTTKTVAITNETRNGMPSNLPSDPCPREGKGKGNESKGGGHHRGRGW
jgi:hypothetical protein